jgi:hypothetical protein
VGGEDRLEEMGAQRAESEPRRRGRRAEQGPLGQDGVAQIAPAPAHRRDHGERALLAPGGDGEGGAGEEHDFEQGHPDEQSGGDDLRAVEAAGDQRR